MRLSNVASSCFFTASAVHFSPNLTNLISQGKYKQQELDVSEKLTFILGCNGKSLSSRLYCLEVKTPPLSYPTI